MCVYGKIVKKGGKLYSADAVYIQLYSTCHHITHMQKKKKKSRVVAALCIKAVAHSEGSDDAWHNHCEKNVLLLVCVRVRTFNRLISCCDFALSRYRISFSLSSPLKKTIISS